MAGINGSKHFDGGTLYLCATPIGNLGDITLRVLDCLKCADLVAAENPHHTRKLLNYYGIRARLTSYREANREKKSGEIISRLKGGARVVLLSDAGMPGISDPGFYLIRRLQEEEIPYTVLPGASAVLTALISSAYPGGKFVFWGFPGRKRGSRRRELEMLAREEKTIVLYESPHRLLETLKEMGELMADREMTVCRELTKKFEEVIRGTPGYLFEYFSRSTPQGEITLVISPHDLSRHTGETSGRKPSQSQDDFDALKVAVQKKLRAYLDGGCTPAGAAKKVASTLPISRRQAYLLLLELKKQEGLE